MNTDMSAQVSYLLQQRNSQLPFYRLHPELICDILSKSLEPPPTIQRTQQLSTVSVHWRSLVLGCTQLWSNIDLACAGVKLAVERSLQAPLGLTFDMATVQYNPKQPSLIENLCIVSQHTSRWRSLSFTGPQMLLRLWDPLIACPLPCLEALELADGDSPLSAYQYGQEVVLPYQGGTRLKRLNLVAVRLNWSIPVLPNLRHLRLEAVNVEALDLLGMLSSTPLLEDLHLLHVHDPSNKSASASIPTMEIQAPRLQELRLEAVDRALVLALAGSLVAESLTCLHLRHPRIENGTLILPALARSAHAPTSLLEAVIQNAKPARLELTVTFTGLLAPITLTGSANNITPINVTLTVGLSETIACLASLFHATAPFTPLHVIVKSQFIVPFAVTDLIAFTRLPDLRSLNLEDGLDYRELVTFLSSPQARDGGPEAWPCPDLTELRLANPYGQAARALIDTLVDVRGHPEKGQVGQGALSPGERHLRRPLRVYLDGDLYSPLE